MQEFVFYATFGSGQPGFPGYLKCVVDAASKDDAELQARERIQKATGGRWCGLYESLQAMHEMDRIFRGEC